MKKDIHPDYHQIKVVMTDGSEFLTYSTHFFAECQAVNAFERGQYVFESGYRNDLNG